MTGTVKVAVPELIRERGMKPEDFNISAFSRRIDASWETARDLIRGKKGDAEDREFEAIYLDTLARLIEYFGLEDDPLAVGRILRYVKNEDNGSEGAGT